MRCKVRTVSEIAGTVSLETTGEGDKIVRVRNADRPTGCEYRYARHAELDSGLADGAEVTAGQRLLRRSAGGEGHGSLMEQFQWRVRPAALLREMLSMLDETQPWVNLSDGGHIENLAAIELLRRRCRFIIIGDGIGDGEADPKLHFNGLATLIRYARIDLGIDIAIELDDLRLVGPPDAADRRSLDHFALGQITYPGEEQPGCQGESVL